MRLCEQGYWMLPTLSHNWGSHVRGSPLLGCSVGNELPPPGVRLSGQHFLGQGSISRDWSSVRRTLPSCWKIPDFLLLCVCVSLSPSPTNPRWDAPHKPGFSPARVQNNTLPPPNVMQTREFRCVTWFTRPPTPRSARDPDRRVSGGGGEEPDRPGSYLLASGGRCPLPARALGPARTGTGLKPPPPPSAALQSAARLTLRAGSFATWRPRARGAALFPCAACNLLRGCSETQMQPPFLHLPREPGFEATSFPRAAESQRSPDVETPSRRSASPGKLPTQWRGGGFAPLPPTPSLLVARATANPVPESASCAFQTRQSPRGKGRTGAL